MPDLSNIYGGGIRRKDLYDKQKRMLPPEYLALIKGQDMGSGNDVTENKEDKSDKSKVVIKGETGSKNMH